MARDAHRTGTCLPLDLASAAYRGVKDRMSRRRAFRQTARDLAALSDGELKVLGLSREMIRPVARQTANAA